MSASALWHAPKEAKTHGHPWRTKFLIGLGTEKPSLGRRLQLSRGGEAISVGPTGQKLA